MSHFNGIGQASNDQFASYPIARWHWRSSGGVLSSKQSHRPVPFRAASIDILLRAVVVAIACTLIAPSKANAQGHPAVNPHDSTSVAEAEKVGVARLMYGISLTTAKRERARQIIHKALLAPGSIPLSDPDRLAKWIEIVRKRDAALEALLSSRADSLTFESNAAGTRPRAHP
jgi:hypothetical protein